MTAAPKTTGEPPTSGLRAGALLLRAEDWLLVGWVAIAAPVLDRAQGGSGSFDAGHPIDGTLRLVATIGALAGLAARRAEGPAQADASILRRGAVGPFIGGLLIMAGSGIAAFGGPPEATSIVLAGAALVVFVAMRWFVRPLSISVRRALVAPFVMAAAGLFWSIVDSVIGDRGLGAFGVSFAADPGDALVVIGIFALFSAIFYAMLIYAPRQVIDREGSPLSWLARFGVFVAGGLFGLGWLRAMGL